MPNGAIPLAINIWKQKQRQKQKKRWAKNYTIDSAEKMECKC